MTTLAGTLWDQVGLWRVRAAPDPDAAPRPIALPVAWDEAAAAALAALAPGSGPVVFPKLAEAWINRLALRGRELGMLADAAAQDGFTHALRALLLARRGAPGMAIWRDEARGASRFVLNLPAFLDAEGGFDARGYVAAVALAVRALDIWSNAKAPRLCVGFADLAGLLASLGLRYGSAEARDVGAAIAALTRGAAEAESGRLAELLGAREPLALFTPEPPAATAVPGLAEAARAALLDAAGGLGLRHQALVALAVPDCVEALLGAEIGGLAPAPGAVHLAPDQHGWVTEVPTRAALRIGRAAAEVLLAPVPDAEWAAMAKAIAPFLHVAPPMPVADAASARAAPALPDRVAAQPLRPSGSVWRVSVGGHKVVLRTAEDQQGRLSEVTIALTKESAAYRSLMDAMLQAVSIGLASGVRLDSFIEAYAYTRFGPAGTVEGDPAIRRATSVLDWAFRRLALDYLGRRDLADPSEEDCAPDATGHAAEQLPLLPMDLPSAPRIRRRQFKLVG